MEEAQHWWAKYAPNGLQGATWILALYPANVWVRHLVLALFLIVTYALNVVFYRIARSHRLDWQ